MGEKDVLLKRVARRPWEGKTHILIADEDVVANGIVVGHVVVRGADYADGEVALDDAIFGSLVEVIGRGAVAARIDDVADEVASQDQAVAGEAVDSAAIVQLGHSAVYQVVLDAVVLPAAVDSGIWGIVNFVMAV